MKLLGIFVIAVALLAQGCMRVPANKINISAPSGTYNVETPKNVKITDFSASVTSNGVFTLNFGKWESTNDPQVIDKVSAGRVAEIKAYGELSERLLETGMKAAGKTVVP